MFENRDKIIALLNEGICPLCGKKYKKPLMHINSAHGLARNEFKDMLLIPRTTGFAPDDLRALNRETAIKYNFARNFIPNRAKPGVITRKKLGLICSENIKNNPEIIKPANASVMQKVVKISPTGEMTTYNSIADAIRQGHTKSIYKLLRVQKRDGKKHSDKKGNRWVYFADLEQSLKEMARRKND